MFVFFQNYYKVFRFIDDRFADEPNETTIPWGLKHRGDAKQFGLDIDLDTIFAAAYMADQIFIVTANVLYSTPIDIRAKSLRWTKLAENPIFSSILGAFVSANQLIFNRNESPESMALMYDRNGNQTKKVCNYFHDLNPILTFV